MGVFLPLTEDIEKYKIIDTKVADLEVPDLIEKNNKAREELKSNNEAYTNNLRRRYLLEANDDNDTPDYTKDDNDAAGNAADGDNPTDYTIPDDEGSGEDNDTAEQADDNDTPDYTKDGDNEGNDDNPDTGSDADTDMGGDPGDEDTGDDGGDDADTEDNDDYGSDEPSSNEDDNPVLKLQKDIFSDLSEEQMVIKDKELRKRFYTMYNSIDNIIERINNIPKTTAIIKPIEFVSRKLDETSSLLNDYITATYDTLSYIENEINYNKFFAIMSGISQAIEGIANQANSGKK